MSRGIRVESRFTVSCSGWAESDEDGHEVDESFAGETTITGVVEQLRDRGYAVSRRRGEDYVVRCPKHRRGAP